MAQPGPGLIADRRRWRGGCGCAVFAEDKVYGTARRGWGHQHPSLPRWRSSCREGGGRGEWEGAGGTQGCGDKEGSWGHGDCVNQGRHRDHGDRVGTQSYGDQGGRGERGHGVLGTVGIRGTWSCGQHHGEQCWGGNGRIYLWLCQRDPIPGHCCPLGTTVPSVPPALGCHHPLGAPLSPSRPHPLGASVAQEWHPTFPLPPRVPATPGGCRELRCPRPTDVPIPWVPHPAGTLCVGEGGWGHPAMTAAL